MTTPSHKARARVRVALVLRGCRSCSPASSRVRSRAGAKSALARTYAMQPPAPEKQTAADAAPKAAAASAATRPPTARRCTRNPAVMLGCTDCHGGDAAKVQPAGTLTPAGCRVRRGTRARRTCCRAIPSRANWPTSANPERTLHAAQPRSRASSSASSTRATTASRARPAAPATCRRSSGGRAQPACRPARCSGAAPRYNNGILPYKHYILGEVVHRERRRARGGYGQVPIEPTDGDDEEGHPAEALSAAAWETVAPGDIFRVFERGGRVSSSQFPEIGSARIVGVAAEARRARPARHPAVEPRAGHRRAHRGAGASTSPRRA